MNTADAKRLQDIKSFPSLVKYLRDDLDWPIDSDDFDEITFEYDPASELGLDPKTAAKVQEVKQLRPFVTGQPWGIFFVKFEPKRLPVVALRRLLASFVFKKRASANKAERAAWNLHDLLFISQYGESDERQISFAHFAEEAEGDLPTLKVLGWDGDDTNLKLDYVHRELTRKMRFEEGDERDPDAWRSRWSSAFTLGVREVIRTSKDLAVELAHLAQRIRRKVNSALAIETDKGPLRRLMTAFREALIHDLKEDDFADMYAQTISYGLLSARISRYAGPGEPGVLTADNLTDMVPLTNPFLRELFQTFLHVGGRRNGKGKNGHIDFDELGVSEVVELLRAAKMDAVLRDFDNRNPAEDPVTHFYEDFLNEYDGVKRKRRGVYYTPKPVVSYIVRSVHELLQTEFGLEDGLADTTTWGEMLKRMNQNPDRKGAGSAVSPSPSKGEGRREGLRLPEIEVVDPKTRKVSKKPIDPATPFVQTLDPATGTATFLVEVIDVIHKTMVAKWKKQGHTELYDIPKLWNEYVPKHLLPRLHGYELMMAPYAIAHMKIGLKLFETGYKFGSGERARIYLTNALEPPQDFSDTFQQMAPALAHEAEAVNHVKRRQRFTVVLGNPPYSGESANKGDWIENSVREAYQYIDGQKLKEKGKKNWLLDDYVKFLRVAHAAIVVSDVGIVGVISNNAFHDNPTFRGLRHSFISDFSRIALLDLHGSGRRASSKAAQADGNVFDILQGVSISLLVRSSPRTEPNVVRADLWGAREYKYSYLHSNTLTTTKVIELKPRPGQWYFIELDLEHDAEWQAFRSLLDVFPVNGNGMISAKDHFAYAKTPEELEANLSVFLNEGISDTEASELLGINSNSMWSLGDGRKRLRREVGNARKVKVAVLPFDERYSLFHRDVIFNLRLPVTKHIVGGGNLVLKQANARAIRGSMLAVARFA